MKYEMSEDPNLIADADPKRKVPCDICGASMIDIHCKLRCPSCGFTRDCSDP